MIEATTETNDINNLNDLNNDINNDLNNENPIENEINIEKADLEKVDIGNDISNIEEISKFFDNCKKIFKT